MATKANIGAKISLDGEKEYRQAISSVSKSMISLRSELKAVSSEYEGNANSLDALRAKNDILVKQQSEQEKKLKLLRGALEDVTNEYGANSEKAQSWQTKLNNAYAELNRINNSLSSNQKYMKEAESSTDKTSHSIDQFGKKVKDSKEETLKFGDVLKANLLSDAIVNGIEMLADKARDLGSALIDVVKSTATYADNILVMSTNTGISTDTLQELSYMAELTDTSLETITSTMEKNIRSMNSAKNGTSGFTDAYKRLGVQVVNSNGELNNSQDVFWGAIDALGIMTNETERDALAMQIFGKSAQDLNSLIAIGSDGVAKFSSEARNMGAVLSKETLEGLGKTDDAIQRLQQQVEISKRTIGTDMAPAVTEAITRVTDKIDEVDEKFAGFAGGALEDVADGFIWIIDNFDLVVSGLKGIAAALISKKAADGITYAVEAYKTLTVATETATAAQTAFNTASKANVIGAIASVVIGLGTALYSYAKSSADAAEENRKLNDETVKLIETSKQLHEEVKRNIDSRKESTEATESEYEAAKKLSSSLYDLASKENKTSSEKAQMIELTKQLNELIPDLNLSINNQTGALSKQRGEVNQLIEAELQLQRVQLAGANIAQIELDKINEEKTYNELIDSRIKKEKELANVQEELRAASLKDSYSNSGYNLASFEKSSDLNKVNKELKEINSQIDESKNKIKSLNSEYDTNMKYIGDHSAVAVSASSMDTIIEQYKIAMQDNANDAVDTVDVTTDKINDIYDAASDALERRLKKEKAAFEEAQEKETKAVEKAQEKELKLLDKNHQKKLDMINEEYLEKMKVVDEDRYKQLKAVQDQIDSIDNQKEAEDRALKLREEAEKKAELQSRVNNAATIDEKIQAQEDLADYESEIARDRLNTERNLQKDILEKQKETINDAFDTKIDTLKKEQDAQEKKADTEYQNEKKAIDERYQLKFDALKKEQELEKQNLDDKEGQYKQYLSDQKDLAIQNAKDIYEADLKQFRLNEAMKYDEFEASQSAMFGYIKEQAIRDMTSGKNVSNSEKILSAKNLDEALKYYSPNTSTTGVSQSLAFDYSAMEDAMSAALKKLKLTVVIDKKTFGSLVQSEVNGMLY